MTKRFKKSTDSLIDDAVARQNNWMERRSAFAKRFLKSMNIFAKTKDENQDIKKTKDKKSVWKAYWFPILCVVAVILIVIWVVFFRGPVNNSIESATSVPEPIIRVLDELKTPAFDIVRIQPDGNIVVAGRWVAGKNISVILNDEIVATILCDKNGEFSFAPSQPLKPGNYTLSLVDEDGVESENKVFLYISEHGAENSVSLLMTPDGSTLLQKPALRDGDLAVSKIDYLDTGRIVVTGDALPRLRVTLHLDDEYLGYARVSDYKHFGLGADVGDLEPGREYKLSVRLHDGDNRRVATIAHSFTMPESTGADDTFYTVRRGDCLWIIARNFMRRGILFSIIATANDIENPDLIFPEQKLQIPVK
jgi:LysM repeat protein